jgi:GntR family transcriptional regulator
VIPPPDVRSILRLGARGKATVRRRRYLLDGKPVLVATSYLPTSLVADSAITQQDTGPGGTYARLAELGFAPAYFREDVTARMPTADESEALRIPPGTPVLDITRTAVTSDGEPVEVNRMTLDAAAYVVRYDFDA